MVRYLIGGLGSHVLSMFICIELYVVLSYIKIRCNHKNIFIMMMYVTYIDPFRDHSSHYILEIIDFFYTDRLLL